MLNLIIVYWCGILFRLGHTSIITMKLGLYFRHLLTVRGQQLDIRLGELLYRWHVPLSRVLLI